jgi:hypothetical protein
VIGHDRWVKRAALVGSLVAHGVLCGVLLSIHRDAREATPARAIDIIEIVAPPAKPPPPPQPAPAPSTIDSPGGGGGTPAAPRPKPTVRTAAHTVRDLLGSYAIEGGTGDGGTGGGELGGFGDARGRGIGLGDGGAIASQLDVPAVPPPPVSKARPPKLIYPSRQSRPGEGTDDLFVARVTVDTDGYVAGAHLVHGLGDTRDNDAEQLIFRFRYAPALDDDGRPIKATIDQPFFVR